MTTPTFRSGVSVPALVTAVIPHYGAATPTLRLLQQLSRQTDAHGLHVVVSDDASPEPFVLPGLDENGHWEDSALHVTVVHRAANGGFGANVNSGLAEVTTPLALVLNSDLEIESTFVSDLIRAALPWQPAVVAPRVVNHDGSEQWTGRHFHTVAHQAVEWLSPLARWRHTRLLHEAVGHDTRAAGATTVTVDWVMGAAMLLPVEQVRQVGGFAEDYFMNAEEVDLQLRLRALGVASVVTGAVTATHEGGGSSDPVRRRTWLVDARVNYAEKWGRPRTLKAALTAATAVNLAVNSVRAVAGRDIRPVRTAREELALIHPRLRGRNGSVT